MIPVNGELMETAAVEQLFRFKYQAHLSFTSKWTERWLTFWGRRYRKQGLLSTAQQWMGMMYRKEIEEGAVPPVSIRWIDKQVGCGLFAEAPIPQMGFIGTYAGQVRRRKRRDRHNAYCFALQMIDGENTAYIIDARDQGNWVRFINHSKTPNCTPHLATIGAHSYILLLTNQPIPKGAELTYDYGDAYWAKRPPPV